MPLCSSSGVTSCTESCPAGLCLPARAQVRSRSVGSSPSRGRPRRWQSDGSAASSLGTELSAARILLHRALRRTCGWRLPCLPDSKQAILRPLGAGTTPRSGPDYSIRIRVGLWSRSHVCAGPTSFHVPWRTPLQTHSLHKTSCV